jgi:DNA-binding CsgD family transcriptional regulator
MKRILILLLLLKTVIGQCQHQRIIDSLYKLEAATIAPKEKLPILFELFKSLRYRDSLECDGIGHKGIAISKQLNDKRYESIFLSGLATIYYFYNNDTKFLNTVNLALAIAHEYNSNQARIHAWMKLGTYNLEIGKVDSSLYYFLKAEEIVGLVKNECQLEGMLYYNLAKLYTDQYLNEKGSFYGRKALQKADECKDQDIRNMAFFISATVCTNIYEQDSVVFQGYRDSALNYYNSILKNAKHNAGGNKTIIANTLYNIGGLYDYYDTQSAQDSAYAYYEKSRQMHDAGNNGFIFCLLRLKQAKILLKRNNFQEAKKILDQMPQEFGFLLKNVETAKRYYEAKYLYAKLTQNYNDALHYKELELIYKDSFYGNQKAVITQRTETQFKNYKQELELNTTHKQILEKKQLNNLYLTIAILGTFGLVFMLIAYYYRKRNYKKVNALLEKEKNEAQLVLQVNEEIALNAIIEKELIDQEKLAAVQEKLLTDSQKEKLQQELMSNRLQLDRKNSFLKELKQQFPQLKLPNNAQAKGIAKTLDKSIEVDNAFELLQTTLENTNPYFFGTLQNKAMGTLSKLDLKYCGYIKIGMTTKEIASIMNIEVKSMRMARYRLKQKLTLDKDEDLDTFINKM